MSRENIENVKIVELEINLKIMIYKTILYNYWYCAMY